jgi:alkaline phosphatase D
MQLYPYEYQDLMNFLALHNISGVLFITGDRHHSEIISLDRPGLYPLYDITTSPLTAGVSKVRGAELNHPNRVPGTLFEEQNFSKFSISGPKNQRVLTVDFIGLKGNKLGSWSIAESKLKRTPTATAN